MAKTKKAISKKAKNANKKTHIAIVLDRSGSMSSIHKQTVDGINQQFEAFRKGKDIAGDTGVSLIQFDTVIETRLDDVKPAELKEWAMSDFQPRGGTAMYDGIWNAINHLKTKEVTDDTAYLICVISDGEENSSREISQQTLADEIKRLQDGGNWTFQYLMANVDIQKIRQTFNANINNIAAYNSTAMGSSAAYTVTANSSLNYMSTRGSTVGAAMNTSYTAFSDEDKKKLIDTK